MIGQVGCHCHGSGYTVTINENGSRLVNRCECVCKECNGSGFVYVYMDSTRSKTMKPGEAGAVAYAKRCSCREKTTEAARANDYLIPERFKDCSFNSFVPRHVLQRTAMAGVKKWCNTWEKGRGSGLFISGPAGQGKTHLAIAALRDICGRFRLRGRFQDTTGFFHLLRSSWKDETTEAEIYDAVLRYELVILDDMGHAESKPKEHQHEAFFRIINERYLYCRSLIVTSKLRLSDLEAAGYENRYVKLLRDVCKEIEIRGVDYGEENSAGLTKEPTI